jgi:hypothetical protein
MQLEQKYELLEAVGELRGEQDQTIPAWERSTGKLVFVHLLAGGYNTENNALLTAVGRLSPEHRQHVLAAGDHAGSAYVITDALPWGMSLRNWITNMSPKGEAPPQTPPPAPEASAKVERPVSDASEMSRAGTWRIPAFDAGIKSEPVAPRHPEHTPPAAPKAEPSEAPPTAIYKGPPVPTVSTPAPANPEPAAAPEREPGEFTRLMRAAQSEPGPTLEMPMPAQSGPVASQGEGEFTRLMRAAKVDPSATLEMPGSTPAAPVAPEAKPGEFTQLMRAFKGESAPPPVLPVQPIATPPEPPRVASQVPPPIELPAIPNPQAWQKPADVPITPVGGPEGGSAGEFTDWLQQPLQAPKPKPIPPPPAETPWQFDKPAAPAPPPVQPAPPVSSGRGEFTRMFQTPRTPAAGLPAAPPVPQGEGGFTQLLRTPASPAGGIFERQAPGGSADADLFATPGRGTPNVSGGPSFTQVLAAGTPAPPAAAPPAPAPKEPAPAKPQRSYLPLILILGLLFLVMVALIVILLLGRK